MWRHGDVLISSTTSIPTTAKIRPGTVLAYGEITGHSHRVQDPHSAELWEHGGVLFLKVVADNATIIHEEHQPITLPRGLYRVWMQREYTPQAIRRIAD
jgi:hypothetical protein